jgi:hypothetical protein
MVKKEKLEKVRQDLHKALESDSFNKQRGLINITSSDTELKYEFTVYEYDSTESDENSEYVLYVNFDLFNSDYLSDNQCKNIFSKLLEIVEYVLPRDIEEQDKSVYTDNYTGERRQLFDYRQNDDSTYSVSISVEPLDLSNY